MIRNDSPISGRIPPRRPASHLLPGILALGVLAGCENPVEWERGEEHLEAVEVVLREMEGAEVTRSDAMNDRWLPSPLVLEAGGTRSLLVFWVDFHDHEFLLTPDDHDHHLMVEVEPLSALSVEIEEESLIHLGGTLPGTARIRFALGHHDHPDFESPWLDVRIEE